MACFMEIPLANSTSPESSQERLFGPEIIDIVSTIGSKQTNIDLHTL